MAAIVIVAASAAGTARAQSFDLEAQGAVELRNPRALAALLWSQTVDCDKQAGDLARRQCAAVRAARIDAVTGKSFLVPGDGAAVELGPYDAKSKNAQLTIRSCLACQAPLDVDGVPLYLVGDKGSPELSGAALAGPIQFSGARAFASAEEADRWRSEVLPRLRAHFVIKLAARAPDWKKGAMAGLTAQIVGFRVHDPCRGEVVAAQPQAAALPPDKRACTGEPVEDKVEPEPVPVDAPEEVEPPLRAKLDSNDIKAALAPAREAAQKCFEVYGVPGTAHFHVIVNGEGQVVEVEQTKDSDFVDTPTGTCIAKAIQGATFPKSKKKLTELDYPFMLR
jgi:hypothetical protein